MKPPRTLTCLGVLIFALTSLLPIVCITFAPFFGNDPRLTHDHTLLLGERHWRLAINSLAVAAGATFLALALGVPLAFLISKTNLIGRNLFSTVCVLPILIPPFMHAIVWSRLQQMIGPTTGLQVHSVGGAIWVLGLAYYPFVTLLTMSGLRVGDRSLEEAALLSRGKWCTLRHISLPLTTPHIFTGAIFVFVFSIMDFGVPDIMRVAVYPVEIFVQFSAFYNERAAAIYSLPLITVALILMILQRRLMRDRAYVSPGGGVSGVVSYALGSGNIPGFLFCCLVFGLSVGVPVAVLVKGAGSWSNYLRVFQTSVEQTLFSFSLAAAAATLAVLLALLLSYLMVRSTGWQSTALSIAVFIPFVVPSTSLGVGLIELWNRPLVDMIYSSPLIVVMGYLSRYLPFAVVTIHSGLKQIDQRLEEAASLAVGEWTRVMRQVVVPLLWPSILSGFFVVFVLSLGELGTTLLVIPPGRETIPIKIYNLMHYGADSSVAALCLIMTAASMLSAGLLLLFLRQTGAARLRSFDARY
jgi:iron(III) transport system permease protein